MTALAHFLVLGALALGPGDVQVETPVDARPNIVVLLIDDLGWNNAGFMPGDVSRAFVTPHLDNLASEGLVFDHAYANAPNCAPSRAALMSGMWAQRTGVYTVASPARGPAEERLLKPAPNRKDLDGRVVTLAEVLHGAGYATCHVGKWHLGGDEDTLPQAQGFDVNVAGDETGMPDTYLEADGGHLTRRMTDAAIAFLREKAGRRPLFLFLSFYAVHAPYEPEPALLEAARKRLGRGSGVLPEYAALVDGLDLQVGRLLAALEELELAENTLVVLASDNGGPGRVTHQRPLRGCKGMYYEGGIRVPLVVRWPGEVRAARSDEPVQLFDLYPTLAAAAHAALPDGQPVDGVSLLPLLRGERAELGREALYWHFPAYVQASPGVDDGPRPGWRATPCSVAREGRWKLIESFEDGRLELYDLERDPSERHDRAQEEPERAAAMGARLAAWRARTDAPEPARRAAEKRPR